MSISRKPAFGFIAILASSISIGTLVAIYFQFGKVSPEMVLSVFQSQALGDFEPATMLNFAFFIALFFLVQAILAYMIQDTVASLWIGSGGMLASLVFALTFVLDFSPVNGNLDSSQLSLDDEKQGSHIVHIFVESWAPRNDELYGSKEAQSFVPESAPGSPVSVAFPARHGNTMLGLLSSWCGQEMTWAFDDGSGLDENEIKSETCLHDVLGTVGYESIFLTGYDTRFQSKDVYLEAKGVSVYDKTIWDTTEPSSNLSSWRDGLNDKTLLAHALSTFQAITSQDSKLYASILTLDTHKPLTFPSWCERADEAETLEVVYGCSAEEVRRLVSALTAFTETSGPILLVMQGDHPQDSGEDVFFWSACLADKNHSAPSKGRQVTSSLEIADHILIESKACSNR